MKAGVTVEIDFYDLFELKGEVVKIPRVTKKGATAFDEEWRERVTLSPSGEALVRFLREGYGLEINQDIFKNGDIKYHLENYRD